VQITINAADGVPIYRQIVNRTLCLMALGLLKPDEELPSIRALALRLKVAQNTIVRAYEELHAMGVVHKRRGSGTFVATEFTRTVDAGRRRIIEHRIDALLAEAQQMNFTIETIVELMFHRHAIASGPEVGCLAGEFARRATDA
jgi:GntR family transcriptional regulator